MVEKVTSTDNAIVRFDGTTGKVQNSGVIIDDNNNVGIGVGNPSSSLTVKDGITLVRQFNNATARPDVTPGVQKYGVHVGTDNSDDGFLRLSAGGGTNAYAKSYIDLSGYSNVPDMYSNIVFGTSGSEKMRIAASGNLLVGTTTDNGVDKLQVNGSISASNKLVYQSNIVGTFTGGEWYDTGVSTNTLGYNILDTFAITIYENSYETGNANWQMSYKFIVGSASTVSNNSNTLYIPTLSAVGHATFGGIVALRWQLVGGRLPAKIQFKVTYTSTFDNSEGKTLMIYVTKLI